MGRDRSETMLRRYDGAAMTAALNVLPHGWHYFQSAIFTGAATAGSDFASGATVEAVGGPSEGWAGLPVRSGCSIHCSNRSGRPPRCAAVRRWLREWSDECRLRSWLQSWLLSQVG